ncbi:MAG: hypothetical protein ACHQ03_09400 [Candidatus Bathyarchaeia archaeon]
MNTTNEGDGSERLISLCVETLEQAKEEGVVLRVIGALAFRIHTRDLRDLHQRLGRRAASGEVISDMDFISYRKIRGKVEKFLERIGYTPDRAAQMLAWVWGERAVYLEPHGKYHADIFFDKLEMSHTIDFKNRLEVDFPTIPLAELMMEKMQIVQINEKDLKDCTALLVGHEVGSRDCEVINGQYIAKVLANDWGFWYTMTTNLQKLKTYLAKLNLTLEEREIVDSRIGKLLNLIEQEPKTSTWQKRAKTGTSKQWYRDVEEID